MGLVSFPWEAAHSNGAVLRTTSLLLMTVLCCQVGSSPLALSPPPPPLEPSRLERWHITEAAALQNTEPHRPRARSQSMIENGGAAATSSSRASADERNATASSSSTSSDVSSAAASPVSHSDAHSSTLPNNTSTAPHSTSSSSSSLLSSSGFSKPTGRGISSSRHTSSSLQSSNITGSSSSSSEAAPPSPRHIPHDLMLEPVAIDAITAITVVATFAAAVVGAGAAPALEASAALTVGDLIAVCGEGHWAFGGEYAAGPSPQPAISNIFAEPPKTLIGTQENSEREISNQEQHQLRQQPIGQADPPRAATPYHRAMTAAALVEKVPCHRRTSVFVSPYRALLRAAASDGHVSATTAALAALATLGAAALALASITALLAFLKYPRPQRQRRSRGGRDTMASSVSSGQTRRVGKPGERFGDPDAVLQQGIESAPPQAPSGTPEVKPLIYTPSPSAADRALLPPRARAEPQSHQHQPWPDAPRSGTEQTSSKHRPPLSPRPGAAPPLVQHPRRLSSTSHPPQYLPVGPGARAQPFADTPPPKPLTPHHHSTPGLPPLTPRSPSAGHLRIDDDDDDCRDLVLPVGVSGARHLPRVSSHSAGPTTPYHLQEGIEVQCAPLLPRHQHYDSTDVEDMGERRQTRVFHQHGDAGAYVPPAVVGPGQHHAHQHHRVSGQASLEGSHDNLYTSNDERESPHVSFNPNVVTNTSFALMLAPVDFGKATSPRGHHHGHLQQQHLPQNGSVECVDAALSVASDPRGTMSAGPPPNHSVATSVASLSAGDSGSTAVTSGLCPIPAARRGGGRGDGSPSSAIVRVPSTLTSVSYEAARRFIDGAADAGSRWWRAAGFLRAPSAVLTVAAPMFVSLIAGTLELITTHSDGECMRESPGAGSIAVGVAASIAVAAVIVVTAYPLLFGTSPFTIRAIETKAILAAARHDRDRRAAHEAEAEALEARIGGRSLNGRSRRDRSSLTTSSDSGSFMVAWAAALCLPTSAWATAPAPLHPDDEPRAAAAYYAYAGAADIVKARHLLVAFVVSGAIAAARGAVDASSEGSCSAALWSVAGCHGLLVITAAWLRPHRVRLLNITSVLTPLICFAAAVAGSFLLTVSPHLSGAKIAARLGIVGAVFSAVAAAIAAGTCAWLDWRLKQVIGAVAGGRPDEPLDDLDDSRVSEDDRGGRSPQPQVQNWYSTPPPVEAGGGDGDVDTPDVHNVADL